MGFIRLASNIIILISTSLIGFNYGNRFKKRSTNLLDLEYCIRVLQSEILVGNNPLPKALNNVYKLGKGNIALVFYNISKDLVEGRRGELYSSFQLQEGLLRESYCLNNEDIEMFFSLGKTLGRTNKEDQEKMFTYVIDQINNLGIQANMEQLRNRKLYHSLGVIIGLMIVIIFI